ncbi:MAG: thermonuclease family protein [Pseudomonadota bacterium]
MIAGLILSIGFALAHPAVIDGDTLRDGSERYRVENIDAPERGARAECPHERALAEASRAYVVEWVADARRIEAIPSGRRDRYGRVVARIQIDGVDLGERLMQIGLAQPWRGHKAHFCAAL